MQTPSLFRTRRLLVAAVSLSLLILLSCSGRDERAANEPGSAIVEVPEELSPTKGYILISLDTLRADRLEVYGYSNTSPFLAELAESSFVFDHSYVHVPGTLPSHMSMMTGLVPWRHNVYPPAGRLPETTVTLAEVFREAGFKTAGFTEGGYVDSIYGFDQGFEVYEDETRDVDDTFAAGKRFLDNLNGDSFFLFLHTYSIHTPYAPPARYLSEFDVEKRPEGVLEPTGTNLILHNRGHWQMTPEALAYYNKIYDAGIRWVDDELRSLFAHLAELGLDDQTTVLITSDHGEEFMEHGRMLHEQVFPETLRVPLLLHHPNLDGQRRIDHLVTTVDVPVTLASLAGLSLGDDLDGTSLFDATRDAVRAEHHSGATHAAVAYGKEPGQAFVRATDRSRPRWTREMEITLRESRELRLQSYHEPRDITVLGDGPSRQLRVSDVGWTSLAIEVGAEAKTVRLESSTCAVPARLGTSEDQNCLAFRVRGAPRVHYELYDLTVDPGALMNSARGTLSAPFRNILRWERSATAQSELSPAQAERLKALGYLQ